MRLLLLLAAVSSSLQTPHADEVYMRQVSMQRSDWRLYVYEVPWRSLNISASARALYETMLAHDPPPAHDEGGLYHAVVHDLPRLLPRWEPTPTELAATIARTRRDRATDAGAVFASDVLFLLPLSPYHLCKAAEHPDHVWGAAWAAPKGSIPTSISIATASAQLDGLRSCSITCPTYERALRWLYTHESWQLAPERHVFTHVLSHVLRSAAERDVSRRGQPASVYSRMGVGIVVTAEDRRYDWLEARACGHVVPAPYYSPPFFMLDRTSAGVRAARGTLISESGPWHTDCHRYDNVRARLTWACWGSELRYSRFVRRAAKAAIHSLGIKSELKATTRDAAAYTHLDEMIRAKALMYQRSTFCLILGGDSAITARIFSIVMSLCIPVFLLDRDFLPFQELVPWKNISLRLRGDDLLKFDRHPASTANPLLVLRDLAERQPQVVRELQDKLELARWHLLYHRAGRGVEIAGAAQRPSAGEALVHHILVAAANRQELSRATGDISAVLRCTAARLARIDPADVNRVTMMQPWPKVQQVIQKPGARRQRLRRGRVAAAAAGPRSVAPSA